MRFKDMFSERPMRLTAFGMLCDVEGRILLLRRKQTHYGDGAYGMPGGKVEEGEDLVQGVIREIREEIGCEVEREDCELFFLHHVQDGGVERLDAQFLIKKWRGTPTIQEPEKSDEMRWFSLEALPQITPVTRIVIDAFISGRRYLVTPNAENR